jgi:hypothetical protein
MSNTIKKNKVSESKDELADITFEYEGVEYVMPAPKLWPLEAGEAQEDGRFINAVRMILGNEQYNRWKKSGGKKTLEDDSKLMEALFDAAGVDEGESTG